eukprot:g4094.t1
MSTYLIQIARSMSSPFTRLATWYNQVAASEPFKTAVLTSFIKTGAADVFAQKVVEKRETIDWQRNAVYSVFGFIYLGMFQYYLYNIKFAKWCKGIVDNFGRVGMPVVKVGLDQFVHHPFVYFPVFFITKSLVSGKGFEDAYTKYKLEIWESCKALWGIWLPAQLVNFSMVPRHLRVPYVAAVSFGWTTVLSVMQARFDDADVLEKPVKEAA